MSVVVLGTVRLPVSDASPKAARDMANAVAQTWELADDVAYRARLATSELATNAIRYGIGSTIQVVVSRRQRRLRGEVHDGSPVLPVRQQQACARSRGGG
ncbi:ATP-binding protein [Actinomadura rudentiformis]|uniref:ATP-binding protein n=1 Tax=Actinomadura rudentiformis TaxID=359158 RepID=A0A6H9YUF6_9ACTN|nr:ATP-binding protein [Actinomadura rudentiformis]KAB2344290.1 ATP-binding protein [Actinomadura rudentiformis]